MQNQPPGGVLKKLQSWTRHEVSFSGFDIASLPLTASKTELGYYHQRRSDRVDHELPSD